MPHPPLIRGRTSFNLTPIFLAVGWLLVILGICLTFPLTLALVHQESVSESFLAASFIALFVGGALVLAFYGQQANQLRLREGFLLTILAWCILSFFSSLPFYFSGMTASLTDSIFEAVSALTTTGISLLKEAHYLPHALRFWRLFLQWLGGFGLVLMAFTLLPVLKIGGAQLIASEFSDRSEKIMPRTSKIASFLMSLYIALTGIGALLLWGGGLRFFEALYYSMSALSTGGIVISDQPLELLSPYCKSILILMMVLGGSTLILLISMARGNYTAYLQDEQVRGYYRLLGISSALTSLWIWYTHPLPLLNGTFMAVSAVTTTGFGLHGPYDSFLSLLFLILSCIGGCSGSTTGGVKIFRLQILYRITKNQLLRLLKPYGFFLTFYNRAPVDEQILMSIVTTLFCYLVGWLFFSLALSLWGHTFGDCLSLGASLITNSGLALTPLLDHLSRLGMGEKWVAITAMLCGRFEFITLVTVMMLPFWRR